MPAAADSPQQMAGKMNQNEHQALHFPEFLFYLPYSKLNFIYFC